MPTSISELRSGLRSTNGAPKKNTELILNREIAPDIESWTRCPMCLNFVLDGTIHSDCPNPGWKIK